MLLNHKIRIVKNDFLQEINFERPSFSLDGEMFSCIVSQDYKIGDEERLLFTINSEKTIEVIAHTEDFIEQGWVEVDTRVKLLSRYTKTDMYDLEGNKAIWYYFIDNYGHIQSGYRTDGSDDIYFPEIDVKATEVFEKQKKIGDVTKTYIDEILIPLRYYIINGILHVKGNDFYVAKDEDGNISLLQTLYEDVSIDGEEKRQDYVVVVHDGNKNEWKRQTKLSFIIPKEKSVLVNNVILGKLESYVLIDEEEYIVKEEWDTTVEEPYIVRYINYKNSKKYEVNNSQIGPFPDEFSWVFNIDNKEYYAQYRFVPSEENIGDYLIVYIDSDNCYVDKYDYQLRASRTAYIPMQYYLEQPNDTTIDIDGMVYDVETLEMMEFDGLKEVFQLTEKIFYIVLFNGNRVLFNKIGEYQYQLANDAHTYTSRLYQRVIVNGKEYIKNTDEKLSDSDIEDVVRYPFVIAMKPTYDLTLVQFNAPNTYICKYDLNNDTSITKYKNSYALGIHSDIAANFNKYVFSVPYVPLIKNKEDDRSLDQIFNEDNIGIVDVIPTLKLTRQISNLEIPIGLTTLHGTNLMQEIWVKDGFISKHVNNVINSSVDMEKDIYYPMIDISKDGSESITLTDAEEVIFNIHLRSRDNNWNVREDYIHTYKALVNDDKVPDDFAKEGENEYEGETQKIDDEFMKTSWNICDYYQNYIQKEDGSKGEGYNEFYPPADLIGFFDFNDDDIFYQKNKVGKTFLRLSFYDSKNPKTQSLLGTSTVFLNSNTLFGKFSDLTNNPSSGITYMSPKTWKGKTNFISCSKEAMPTDKLDEFINFQDASIRMGSEIIVNNKFDTTSSAEGFYTYIFREYSSNLHERTIYLRIQLNHAGHGNIIDLLQPMDYNDDGILKLLPLGEIKREGLPLKRLYDLMYIPIKIKYDDTYKKYCWYLPKNLVETKKEGDENKIIFNLFEIKIANYEAN